LTAAPSGAGFGENVAINIMGDLLYGSRSVMFHYNRASGPINVIGAGATTIVNPKVAENISPLPEDRVYYRVNYYNDALSVSGIGNRQILDPTGTVIGQESAVKFHDAYIHTFGIEKTFCDRLFSVEVRVPFVNSLASKLDLNAGRVTGIVDGIDRFGNQQFSTDTTFGDTFGKDDTEFGNMFVLLKGLLCQTRHYALSAGLGIGIPTAPDNRVRVVDFSGDVNLRVADLVRARDFRINNDTWSLSPFLAALVAPSERFFAQGFVQFEFPLNSSTINYSSVTNLPGIAGAADNVAAAAANFPAYKLPPHFERANIDEQTLMHLDFGVGYWLVKNSDAKLITGVVPTAEIHYTTTLDNAQLVTLTGDPLFVGGFNLEPRPVVGNQRNRLDILDVTLGATLVLGDRATIAPGVAFPVKGVDNRTFDWEFLLQFNYYFGGPRTRTPAFQ
jgi:hypothetical protein